jgi:hypothetical protein
MPKHERADEQQRPREPTILEFPRRLPLQGLGQKHRGRSEAHEIGGIRGRGDSGDEDANALDELRQAPPADEGFSRSCAQVSTNTTPRIAVTTMLTADIVTKSRCMGMARSLSSADRSDHKGQHVASGLTGLLGFKSNWHDRGFRP